MKNCYPKLTIFFLAILMSGVVHANNPKKRNRRFLHKNDIPQRIELVVGGFGEHADRYGRRDHFNPFGKFQIGVKVYTRNNKVYGTAGVAGGRFSWDNLNVEVIGGSFNHRTLDRSKVHIAHPDRVPGHKVRLRVSLHQLPGIYREFEVPLDFSYSYTLRSAGITGGAGWEECRRAPAGDDGRNHSKCDGEDGAHGLQGVNGGHGDIGMPGPDIEVVLLPYDDLNSDDMVIEAQETNLRTGRTRTRWYKPGTSTITVISRGGTGGSGGDGQPGGHGGDGGDGGREGDEETKAILADGGNGGCGGRGGRGGHGGEGGYGGQISVFFHPDLADYLGSVRAFSVGGDGGCGGDGGRGGKGGDGGEGTDADGKNGRNGACGPDGLRGPQGLDGPPTRWIPLELNN